MNDYRPVQIGIVIHSSDPETVWNAVRLANFSLQKGDVVKIFLLGRGVEAESLDTDKFHVPAELLKFVASGGVILACGTCMKLRQKEETELCPMSTMADLYTLILESEKILTF